MSTRALSDYDNDWTFGYGFSNYKVQQAEIVQNILTALKSWRNDCFFDMDAGVDWAEYIGAFNTEKELRLDIIKTITSIDGVLSVDSYESYLDEKRKIHIKCNITTIYTTTTIEL